VTAIDRQKEEFKRDIVMKNKKERKGMPTMEEVKLEVDWMLAS